MATIKCKMCGGTMEILENSTVALCEYCGTQQTIPRLSDERKANLYDRANHFRRNNEFDKAQAIYEQILNEDPEDAESYWSLVLCKYGIEYVEDPATHKRIPTVNRTQFTSVFEDSNYKEAIRLSDESQKYIYEEEAKTIDDIQKGILEVSRNEEPFDVFICYKETDENGKRTRDSVLAQELYNELTKEGFKTFFSRITLESKLGTAYEPYIFAALNSSKVMVVLGTKPEFFKAVWVKNEWSRFLDMIKRGEKKTLIPAYREMDPYDLPEEFSFLQAQDMSKLGFMQDLVSGIKKILGVAHFTKDEKESKSENNYSPASQNALLRRVETFLEDGDFDSALKYVNRILDSEPGNSIAYYYLFLAKEKIKNLNYYHDLERFLSNPDILRAYKYAGKNEKAFLDERKSEIEKRKEYFKQLFESYEYITKGDGFEKEIRSIDNRIEEVESKKRLLSELKEKRTGLNDQFSAEKQEIETKRKEKNDKEIALSKCGTFAFREKGELKNWIYYLEEDIKKREASLETQRSNLTQLENEIKAFGNEDDLERKITLLKNDRNALETKKEDTEKNLLFCGDKKKLESEIQLFNERIYRGTKVGEKGPAGGLVFYDKGHFSDGWRFLEAAPADLRVVDGVPTVDETLPGYVDADQVFPFGWYLIGDDKYGFYVNGTKEYRQADCTGTAIGTGKKNTEMLVATMGEYGEKGNYAARLCTLLKSIEDGTTFNDWFLPSKDELNLLYRFMKKVGLSKIYEDDDERADSYWSSSEAAKSPGYAWLQFLSSGDQDEYPWDVFLLVRPVRAF